jgi:hypothetical protein
MFSPPLSNSFLRTISFFVCAEVLKYTYTESRLHAQGSSQQLAYQANRSLDLSGFPLWLTSPDCFAVELQNHVKVSLIIREVHVYLLFYIPGTLIS